MPIQEAIAALEGKQKLSESEAAAAMRDLLNGTSRPDAERFATALHAKGETADELVGMAEAVRESTIKIEADGAVLDTAGTGGDGLRSFNVSTVAAIIA